MSLQAMFISFKIAGHTIQPTNSMFIIDYFAFIKFKSFKFLPCESKEIVSAKKKWRRRTNHREKFLYNFTHRCLHSELAKGLKKLKEKSYFGYNY